MPPHTRHPSPLTRRSFKGTRFQIGRTTLFNVEAPSGGLVGQAVTIREWQYEDGRKVGPFRAWPSCSSLFLGGASKGLLPACWLHSCWLHQGRRPCRMSGSKLCAPGAIAAGGCARLVPPASPLTHARRSLAAAYACRAARTRMLRRRRRRHQRRPHPRRWRRQRRAWRSRARWSGARGVGVPSSRAGIALGGPTGAWSPACGRYAAAGWPAGLAAWLGGRRPGCLPARGRLPPAGASRRSRA